MKITAIKTPDPIDPYRPDAPKVSMALLASDGGHVVVLDHIGKGLGAFMEEVGDDPVIVEEALGVPPPGLWIWEGVYHTSRSYEGEYDAELMGQIRNLTLEDWELYRDTGFVWEPKTWMLHVPLIPVAQRGLVKRLIPWLRSGDSKYPHPAMPGEDLAELPGYADWVGIDPETWARRLEMALEADEAAEAHGPA